MIDKAVDLSSKIILDIELEKLEVPLLTPFLKNLPDRIDDANLSLEFEYSNDNELEPLFQSVFDLRPKIIFDEIEARWIEN